MPELATAWVTIAAATPGMRRDIRRALNDSERDAQASGRRMGERMGKEIGAGVGRELKIAFGAVGVGNLPAVATALTSVASAAQQVAQVGLVLPGVVATGAASLGTLKLATAGVGDSFKKMWEAAESGDPKDIKKAADAIKDLEPNTKGAMTAVVGFHDEFKKLQNTTRGNVFRDVDRAFTRFGNATLPTLMTGMDKTSRAWNNSIREMLRVGSSSSTQGFMDRIFGNTADAQNRANAAIAPLVNAFGTLAAAGSDSVPRLGTAVGNLAERFNAFITADAATGRLNTRINEGLTGVTHLGRTVMGLGQSFTALTKAAGGGEGLLGTLDKGSTALARIMNSAAGQQKLSEFFAEGREQWHNLLPILQAVPPVLGTIYDVSKQWTSAILPPVSQLAQLLAEHTGLVKTAAEAWLLFKTVPTLIGATAQRISPLGNILQSFGQQGRTAYGGVREFGEAYRTMAGYVSQANPGMSTAAVHLRTLQSSAGVVASGGMNALKGAASGLMGALGGPWGLAVTGAVTAIGLLGKAHADAAEAARQQKQAEDALRQTLSAGQVTEQTQAAVAKALEASGASKRAVSYGIDPNDLMRAASGDTATLEALRAKARESITTGLGAYKFTAQGGAQQSGLDVMAQYQKEGVSNDTFMRAMMGNKQAIDEMNKALANSPAAMSGQLTSMEQLLDKMPDVNESIVTMMRSVEQQTGTVQNSIAAWELANRTQYGTWQATEAGVDAFKRLGATIVSTPSDKTVRVSIPPEALAEFNAKMAGIGNTTQNLPDGTVVVTANTDEAIQRWKAYLQKVSGTPVSVPIELQVQNYDAALKAWVGRLQAGQNPGALPQAPVGQRLFGAVVPMADGGLRWMRKPQSADIYAGRGAGTIFAEEATGGEAYIPLAPNKRARSMAILTEVARRFGVNSFESGGISVDELKSFASNIAGNSYNWGGGNGDTFSTDCSGAQSTIANFITGGSGRFATASESAELLKRGFQAGDPPDGVAAYWVGWQNGGPGGGHTAGTIVDPDGGNVNVEMGGKKGGGQYGGGAAGASSFPNRAWIALAGGDNGKSTGGGASASQVMSAQASVRRTKAASAAAQQDLDDANAELNSAPDDKKRKAAEKKRDNAQRRLDAAKDRQATAEQRLTEVLGKKAKGTDKETGEAGAGLGQSFGQSLVSGVFQGLGLDGSVFSNLLEWPNVKSGLALVNWGAGYAKAWANAESEDGQAGAGGGGPLGGALAGLGLPNLAPSTEPKNLQPIGAAGTGTGPLPGPAGDTFNVSGVNPREIMPKLEARQWAATNRHGMGQK